MKTIAFRLFVLFIPFLVVLSSCKKDADKNKFRIISEEYFEDGDSYGEGNYEYADHNLSRYYWDEDDDNSGEAIFDYSEENKIYIDVTEDDAGDEYEYEIEITFSDGNVIEVLNEDDGYKEEYTYNGSDQLVKAKEFDDYGDGWELYRTVTFTYDGDKVEEVLRKYADDASQYKSEYSYDADGYLEEEISYYYYGDEWVEDYKDVYSYTAGRVTEIEYYYFYDGDWEKDNWRDEFEYDENGNLIEEIGIDIDDDVEWTDKYAYAEGSGNYRQIFGSYLYFGRDFLYYPMPTKSTRRGGDISKDHVELCRALNNKQNMIDINRQHKNRQLFRLSN